MVRLVCFVAAFSLGCGLCLAQEATSRSATKKKTTAKVTPSPSEATGRKTTPPPGTPKKASAEAGGLREKTAGKATPVGATKNGATATPAIAKKKKAQPDPSETPSEPSTDSSTAEKSESSKEEKATKTEPSTEAPKEADAETAKGETKPSRAPAATLEPSELAEFEAQPPRVQALITAALALTKLNLTYAYGSADPAQGGMDCSGTMYHVLRAQGFPDVPRDSSSQYVWARKAGPFFAVVSTQADSFEFKDLLPGDLLFWTGTYQVARDVPITHVMLYLGKEKKTGKRVMFGASDGRSYAGIQRWGVSVFDFKMPRAEGGEKPRVDFVGYGRIPALREAEATVLAAAEANPSAPETTEAEQPEQEKAASTPAPRKKTGTRKKK
jgi:cell wall-associated NlpC family hydrolase